MRLGIDASNLSRGGGVTHLIELLDASDPSRDGFNQVVVWGSKTTLSKLKDKSWLLKINLPVMERSLPFRIFWQKFQLKLALRKYNCEVLFVPGGAVWTTFSPTVTMCRNMLPFQYEEMRRYGFSLLTLKFYFLRIIQKRSFRKANGVIYLSEFAKKSVHNIIKSKISKAAVVPHGINSRFKNSPTEQQEISCYSATNPFKIIYVSIIDVYKHQTRVVEAVKNLHDKGYPIELQLVGPSYHRALKDLENVILENDPKMDFIKYLGSISYEELHKIYTTGHLNVFASSCENMPNILLEGMASGLPIACSNRGPMPEILKDGGLYFDPENPKEIAKAIEEYILSKSLRQKKSEKSYKEVNNYSWKLCAQETWTFITKTALQDSNNTM